MQEKNEKKVKKIYDKPQVKFYCEKDFKAEIDKVLNAENLDISAVGRALFVNFLHLDEAGRKKVLACAEVHDLLDRYPGVLDNYQQGILPLLTAALEGRGKKGEK